MTKVAVVGPTKWPDPTQAEEYIGGFISGLPKNTVVIVRDIRDEGIDYWAKKYAQAYKYHITEFTPANIKGAPFHERNYDQCNRDVVAASDRIVAFIPLEYDVPAELAELFHMAKLGHVHHTIFVLGMEDDKLKIADTTDTPVSDTFQQGEDSEPTGSSIHRKPHSQGRVGAVQKAGKTTRSKSHSIASAVRRKKRVPDGVPAKGKDKARRTRTGNGTSKPRAGRTVQRGQSKESRSSEVIVLTRKSRKKK